MLRLAARPGSPAALTSRNAESGLHEFAGNVLKTETPAGCLSKFFGGIDYTTSKRPGTGYCNRHPSGARL